MKTQVKKPENVSHTIQSKASNQATAQQILQRFKDKTLQRETIEEDELLQGKFEDVTQRMELDEEEPLQGKFDTAQRMELDEEEPLQQKSENRTGLPDNLKSGIENMSGFSMDTVRVHYNSPQPAQLQALAYTQGTDIHVAPGQEKHLPHEAWHVVQQMQGRVQPTTQLQGVNINDNAGLEKEADEMGGDAIQKIEDTKVKTPSANENFANTPPIQMERDELEFGYYTKSGKRKSRRVMNMETFGDRNRVHNIEPDKLRERLNGEGDDLQVDEKTGIWRPSKEEGTARPEDPPIYQPIRIAYHKAHNIYTSLGYHSEPNSELDDYFDVLKESATLIKKFSLDYKSNIRNLTNEEGIEGIKATYIGYLDRIKNVLILLTIKMVDNYKTTNGMDELDNDTLENMKAEDGEKIWKEKWWATVQKVNSILDVKWKEYKTHLKVWVEEQKKEGLSYMQKEMIGDLDYIGSLAKGYKSAPKQYLHFLPELFDVDANLDAPSLAVYEISQGSPIDRGSVKAPHIDILKDFENAVWDELQQIHGIDRDDKFEVFIRVNNITDIMGVSHKEVKIAHRKEALSRRFQEIENRIWWLKTEHPESREELRNTLNDYLKSDQSRLKEYKEIVVNEANEHLYTEVELTKIELIIKQLEQRFEIREVAERERERERQRRAQERAQAQRGADERMGEREEVREGRRNRIAAQEREEIVIDPTNDQKLKELEHHHVFGE